MTETPSSSHDAFAIMLESAVEIAQKCCIPRITFQEFLNLSELLWERHAEKKHIYEEIPPEIPEDI